MFAGAEEAIFCAMTAMLASSDHAVVITPCYQSLLSIPKSRCAVTTVDINSDCKWELNIQTLRAAIQPNTKLIVMNWPHNPTGHVPSRSDFDDIIDLARQFNLWVFSDEVYRGLEADDEHRLPTLASVYEKGISLGVVSKCLGLAGLRVGWIACANASTLNAISDVKHYLSICNSAPSEVLALVALRNFDHLSRRVNNIARSNLLLIDSFLERWASKFRWTRPKGGCCGFMEITDPAVTVDEVAQRLVEEFGVLILPGSKFVGCGNMDKISQCFRLGFGRANFPECLAAFEASLPLIFKK